MSGKAGLVRIDVKDQLTSFGIDLNYISVMLSGNKNGKLIYQLSFGFKNGVIGTVFGVLDVEKLILSCSGLLCRAAKALKKRHALIDSSLRKATK